MNFLHKLKNLAVAGVLLASAVATQASASETRRNTEALNKALVVRLYFQFFNTHDLGFAAKVIDPNFIQHNATIATGRQPFVDLIQFILQQAPQANWNIDHISADGDLVWVQVHETNFAGDSGLEIFDIYRVKNGVIVEHWDAGEAVSTAPLNSNTQF